LMRRNLSLSHHIYDDDDNNNNNNNNRYDVCHCLILAANVILALNFKFLK
jgi:hypothetical protein